jgi:cytochrome P450
MLESDAPRHTRLRKLVAREFTPRRIEALRPRVQQITDELLDAALPLGRADLIESFAFPLPITVICELLGVPDLDRTAFSGWTRRLIGEGDGYEDEAAGEVSAYLSDLIEDKRCSGPRDDLLSALIGARYEGGPVSTGALSAGPGHRSSADAVPSDAVLSDTVPADSLTDEELVGMAFLLLLAGHETTVNLITNGTLALLRHPDQLAALRADPGLMDGAIEEMLRYDGPLESATFRFTRAPTEIGGLRIPRGEAVVVALAAANRDGDRFPGPDTFDIRRPAQGHLAFGPGIHYCLGAPLARMEGRIAFTSLLARSPGLALDAPPTELMWRPGQLMRGVQRLPVRF